MRAGLSTIQQTLTPEAATVLNQSIAEAGRRNHGQTTPLHVASTLLASPTGFLRQACIRSHPNSSHPLQCRALELCFSVALERLPTATSSPEPPISNALMAALKRAQAHQRRGCPEQQQQPLLAVKVELEQLIISILDDPSVSRVMREASFSSPAVKATIEQSLSNNNVSGGNNLNLNPSIGFRPSPSPTTTTTPVSIPIHRNLYMNPRLQGNQQKKDEPSSPPINLYLNPRLQQLQKNDETSRNLYLNPRLQQRQPQGNLSSNQLGQQRNDDVKRVIEIMTKPKKKNPILVGELEPEAIRKEIMRRIEKGEFFGGDLKNVEVISIEKEVASMSDKSLMPTKIQELGNLIDTKIGTCDGLIIDLADLKWLVEQPPVSSVGRESVTEMAKLVSNFCADSGNKVWLIGTATCETYLRCQVYHPSMETDWDLQAVPITTRSPLPGVFPRIGTNTVDSLNTMNKFSSQVTLQKRLSENLDPSRTTPCCPKCSADYEQELAKLKEAEKSSDEIKSNLPQWLQNAKTKDQSQVKDQQQVLKHTIQELQKKWSDTCLRDHPNYNQSPRLDRVAPMAVPLAGTYKPNILLRPSQPAQQPRLQPPRSLQEALLQSKSNHDTTQQPSLELPRSPVRTDLVLGPKKASETVVPKDGGDLTVKDLLGCISSEPGAKIQEFHKGKFSNAADTDSFKKLLKGLMKKAWWQPEAASTIATTITQCKVDSGSRGSMWLLFAGPDRVAKKKMASVLAEHTCGANPITIGLGSRRDDEETDLGFRGKTILDRIVEAVRRNPSSVIVLSDIDEADMLVRGSIKRAMERGRLTDSHGREISLGNVVFVLTGNWSTSNVDEHLVDEQRLRSTASRDWQLRLTVGKKQLKRRANWLSEKDRSQRPRKESGLDLSLDLNLAMDYDEDRTDGSINSSNLTMDQEDENQRFAVTSVPHELVGPSDGAVEFKPANFGYIRREIEKTVKNAFSTIVDEKITIEVEEEAVENILGGLWFGRTSLEEWAEQILIPSFHQLNSRLPSTGGDMLVRLESDRDSVSVGGGGDWLPSKIAVVVDGV
ncbi:hypothetical protein L6452_22093 [Arctium lappa]|uniref:Uncharacterized protein n=1 Tax=Arctium lappa TaxID=4217 RepID=A0ACB9AY08_ARCLA|nr:hypothetical protein L6452_22093 [Arctium lappa]